MTKREKELIVFAIENTVSVLNTQNKDMDKKNVNINKRIMKELELLKEKIQSDSNSAGRKPKLTPIERNSIIAEHKNGKSKEMLAVDYNVSISTILRIVNNN